MSLSLPLPPLVDSCLFSYELTEAQELQAKLLSQETMARLTTAVTELTVQLSNMRFSGADHQLQLLQHAYTQGARDKLLELISDAEFAYFQTASSNI